MKKLKIWVIFCEYEEQTFTDDDPVKKCALLDMSLEEAPPSIKEMTEQAHNIEKEHAALHASYFQFMQMQSPKVVAVAFPPITTKIGRRQLTDFVRSRVDTELPDRDFETLFQGIDSGSNTDDRGSK